MGQGRSVKRAAVKLEQVSSLPSELQEKIFSYLPPDLQTLCLTGHILVAETRLVSLPSRLRVRVFAVGGGGGVTLHSRTITIKTY